MPKPVTRSTARQNARMQQHGHLRKSMLVALIVLAVAGILVTQLPKLSQGVDTGFVDWTSRHGFSVQQVHVTGRGRVSSAFIMNALQIKRGMPILAYDPKAARARLLENPWFRTVKIERRLPDTILIRLEERLPAARWQVDGHLALIDGEGVALPVEDMERYRHLPIIIGQNARHKLVDLVTLLRAQPVIGRDVVAATWVGNRRWDLKLKNGILIKLPAAKAELALARLVELNEKDELLARDIVSVDLRLPDQAILEPTLRANPLIERPDFSDKPDLSKKNI